MSETSSIVKVLKRALKAEGVTYTQVAEAIDLSPSSVKRLFAEEDFSLKRLEQICQLVRLDISDLFRLIEEENEAITQLSLEQEKLLISDVKLLLTAVCVLNHLTFNDILALYQFENTELIRCLAKLDKFKLIELLPNNKFRAIMSPTFSWIDKGPIQKYFESHVQHEFLDHSFNQKGEIKIYTAGILSKASNAIMQRRLRSLLNDFREFHNKDKSLSLDERYGTSIVLAMRPWELGAFVALRRTS